HAVAAYACASRGPATRAPYVRPDHVVMWPRAGVDVQYAGQGNDVLHALANDNQRDIIDCGPGYDVAYVIEHDPVTLHGCEKVVRLSPDEAAALSAANDDNSRDVARPRPALCSGRGCAYP